MTVEAMELQRLGVTGAIIKAELDQAIVTARAYPRNMTAFAKQCREMATLNEFVAKECMYAVPRKEEGGGTKMIEGPSARLAEIVVSAWGNCMAGSRTIDEGDEFVTAQGYFKDLERNVTIQREVKRRITYRGGHRYSSDMIAVTANAAGSIAFRNAVFTGVPRAFWLEAYVAARKVIAGDAETFTKRRDEAIDAVKKMGVSPERIYLALGVEGVRDIGVDEVVSLHGLTVAIRDNEITIDEAFPDPTAKPERSKRGMDGLKDAVTGTAADISGPVQSPPAPEPHPVAQKKTTAARQVELAEAEPKA